MSSLEVPQRLGNAGCLFYFVPGCFERDSQGLADIGFVVDDQNSHVWFATSETERRVHFILVNWYSRSKEATAAWVGRGHRANDGPFDFIAAASGPIEVITPRATPPSSDRSPPATPSPCWHGPRCAADTLQRHVAARA